jgi:hypothetical protein
MPKQYSPPSDEGLYCRNSVALRKVLLLGFFLITGAFIRWLVTAGTDTIDYFFAAFLARRTSTRLTHCKNPKCFFL